MKLNQLINNYEKMKKYSCSKGNYDYIKGHLKVLQDFFKKISIKDTNDIRESITTDFIDYKLKRGNSYNTINKEIQLLRMILRENSIYINSLERFKKIKFKRKSYKNLDTNQLKKLLNYIENYNLKEPSKMTNYLLIYLFLYTGCRRTELAKIDIANIDFYNSAIKLDHTKNGDPRIVFYKKTINSKIKKYIKMQPNRKYLFYNFKNDKPLTPENISAIFRYIKGKLGFENFSPHMLRHTMATLLLDNGADVSRIQNMLGHKSLDQTMIYLHLSIKKNKQVYNKCFPKFKQKKE